MIHTTLPLSYVLYISICVAGNKRTKNVIFYLNELLTVNQGVIRYNHYDLTAFNVKKNIGLVDRHD